MREKALNYLAMMRKANAIQIGEIDTGAAIRAQQAKLVLLASDASANAKDRAESFVYGRNVPLIIAPFTKEEISDKVGKCGCSMAAVCDIGFAGAFLKALTAYDSEKYSAALTVIEEQKTDLHKSEDKNKKTGKRRK